MFSGSDAWWLVSDRLDLKLRAHTAAYALIPGSGLLFVWALVGRRTTPILGALLGTGILLALLALGWPQTTVLPDIDRLVDVASGVALVVALLRLYQALKQGLEAASALFMAVAFLVVAAVAERAAFEMGAFGLRLLLPAFLVFIGTAAASLVLRSTDLADRYHMLVKSARDAILVLVSDGTIEDANEAAQVLMAQDIVGKKLEDLVQGGPSDALETHLWRDARGPRRTELQLIGASGRVAAVESVATDLPEGRVMLVMRDITSRRKVELSMLHAARMETVGIIAGGIAHDFNNTMAALMAHIGLLRLKVDDDKDQQRLQRMEAVIRRAAHMTRRLLTLARGGDKDQRPINPAEPVHSAVELTRSMLPRNITIKERVDPDLPTVMGSADDLEQAVLNLLVNARDALGSMEGAIRVWVRYHREQGLPSGVQITVEDNGPGVPDSIRENVWEPFFTTKGEGRGTGLGLSVVARVLREHGGQISLERIDLDPDTDRPGTRFTLTLPSEGLAEPRAVEAVRPDGRRILVVDDEEEIGDMMRSELLTRGYRVTVARSAEEALEMVEQAADASNLTSLSPTW